MKRYLLASLIICVFHITQVQSHEWVKIFPSFDPLGNYNMSLGTFVDEKNGWFTEMFPGRSWQTQDGGLTWNMQIDSSTVWSYNIEFFNSTYGWILGKRISDYVPFLKRTKNGGESWETFSLPGEFVAINFLDSLKGFAGGNDSIYCTVDGGESWQAQTIEAEFFPYVIDIYFVDEQYGWAVGYSGEATDVSVILHTANGGFTWNIFPQDAPILNAVYFPSMMHGCAVGFDFFGGVIMLTNNGGENWEYHYPPSPWLNDVFFTDDSTGWVVGDYGFIWYTEDGGQTWEQVESGTNADLNRIVFVDDGKVGYIHIPDMLSNGLNEFAKQYYPQLKKKALIIDVRGNGGGNVSPMLIERLRREIVMIDVARNTAPTTDPNEILWGPTVCLINEYSASDGDLFPYRYKTLKMGKLIGKRTWGGVVGIRGSLPFLDGGTLHKPEYSRYDLAGKTWAIEGHGVDPTIEIENDPHDVFNGKDAQLDRAIAEIRDELKIHENTIPAMPPYPVK